MANAIPSLGDQKNETVLKNEMQVVLSVKISQLANRELKMCLLKKFFRENYHIIVLVIF